MMNAGNFGSPFLMGVFELHKIKDDHEYLERAMKAYNNPSCITIEEFNRDLYLITNIRKSIRKYNAKEEVNIRRLVNYFVVLYNCFGSTATDLLLYKIEEPELVSVIIPVISYLGWGTSDLPAVEINISIVQDLIEL